MSVVARHGNVLKGDVMRCSEYAFEESTAGWRWLLGGGTTGQRALSKRVVSEEIVQDSAPDLDTFILDDPTLTPS